jgi:hypothetical protein
MPIYDTFLYTNNNFELTHKQREIVNDPSRFKIIQGIRQSGKSSILLDIALKEACENYNKTIFITSPNLTRSYRLRESLKPIYSFTSIPKMRICGWYKTSIEFENGSKIIFSQPHVANSCGVTIDVLLMDDMAFCNVIQLQKFWDSNFLYFQNTGKIILASTRWSRSKKNLFWKTWLGAIEGTNSFKPFTINSRDTRIDKNELKEQKNILGRNNYDREYTIRTK